MQTPSLLCVCLCVCVRARLCEPKAFIRSAITTLIIPTCVIIADAHNCALELNHGAAEAESTYEHLAVFLIQPTVLSLQTNCGY